VVLTGAAAGLAGTIKADGLSEGLRNIELWQSLRAEIAPGDSVRLEAGCDKRPETCRERFDNMANFRGFPTIPGDEKPLNIQVLDEASATVGGGK